MEIRTVDGNSRVYTGNSLLSGTRSWASLKCCWGVACCAPPSKQVGPAGRSFSCEASSSPSSPSVHVLPCTHHSPHSCACLNNDGIASSADTATDAAAADIKAGALRRCSMPSCCDASHRIAKLNSISRKSRPKCTAPEMCKKTCTQ
eukprot:365083-Chlamydomonas_euryale.AAC.19